MKRRAKKFTDRTIDKNIIALAENIKKLAIKALAGYSPEANAIITSGCKKKHRIEPALDGMLDFCWDKQMLELYRRLCRYYYDIDAQAAAGYVLAYRGMWDKQEDSQSKSGKVRKRKYG